MVRGQELDPSVSVSDDDALVLTGG